MQTAQVIPFRAQELLLVDNAGEPFVPMKPVVEGMGLAWQVQHRKLISGRFASTITEMVIVAQDGKQREMSCLPLRKLTGWLMSIHPNKVRPELREGIIAYQNECDDVLWSYWNNGMAVRTHDRDAVTVVAELVGVSELTVLKGLVYDKARAVRSSERISFIHTMHNRLHTRFNVPRIDLIPAQQFEAACNFIAAYALEGEWLEAEKPDQEQDRMNIHWPAQRWIDESPSAETREAMTFGQGRGRIYLAARMLYGQGQPSPTLDALSELESNGYNVEACRLEVLAMRWHLEQFQYELDCTAECIDLLRRKGVRYMLGANKPTQA